MAIVINGTSIKAVKNLGWLRNNWEGVESFTVTTSEPISAAGDYMLQGGYFAAHMADGRVYFCTWASLNICRDWLHRPIFRGRPLNWCGVMTVC